MKPILNNSYIKIDVHAIFNIIHGIHKENDIMREAPGNLPEVEYTWHTIDAEKFPFNTCQTSLHEYRKKKFYFAPIKGLKQNSRFSFLIFNENDFVAAKFSR